MMLADLKTPLKKIFLKWQKENKLWLYAIGIVLAISIIILLTVPGIGQLIGLSGAIGWLVVNTAWQLGLLVTALSIAAFFAPSLVSYAGRELSKPVAKSSTDPVPSSVNTIAQNNDTSNETASSSNAITGEHDSSSDSNSSILEKQQQNDPLAEAEKQEKAASTLKWVKKTVNKHQKELKKAEGKILIPYYSQFICRKEYTH